MRYPLVGTVNDSYDFIAIHFHLYAEKKYTLNFTLTLFEPQSDSPKIP